MRGLHTQATGLVVAAAAACLAPSDCAADDGWSWLVAPYIWAPTITADLGHDQPPVENEAEFSDFVDKIDGVFLGHLEGQGDRFGLFADIVYLSLGDDRDYPRSSTESSLDTTIFELAGVWSPGDGRYSGFDAFAGLRYIDLELDVDIDPVNPALDTVRSSFGESYSDFMVGARYTADFSDHWAMTLRGDGSFGDTEGTWSASAEFQYKLSSGFGAWVFGYRHMDAELESDTKAIDLALGGPIVAFAFAF